MCLPLMSPETYAVDWYPRRRRCLFSCCAPTSRFHHPQTLESPCSLRPEVVQNMRSWEHSGFSVDQSVLLSAGDQAGIERLVQYMVRCPFSLSRLVKVTDTGQVVYKTEKDACHAFPDPQSNDLEAGANRNFQILSPLDFLAAASPGNWAPNTFRPRALTRSATWDGTLARVGACGRRRKRKHRPRSYRVQAALQP